MVPGYIVPLGDFGFSRESQGLRLSLAFGYFGARAMGCARR